MGEFGLARKVALVTGGSEGVGKAIALKLAQGGARVAICGRRENVLNQAALEIREATQTEIVAIPADVSLAQDIQRFVQAAVDRFGSLEVLVNNAGKSEAHSFEEVSDALWTADLELKLFAVIRACRLAIPHMRKSGGGRIVNIVNMGSKAPGERTAPNTVSRGACLALTKVLSKEFARENILVNAVCLGSIQSTHWERRWQARATEDPRLTLEAFYERMGQNSPLCRVGRGEEAANVVAFLASEAASYITGAAINVDGGQSPAL